MDVRYLSTSLFQFEAEILNTLLIPLSEPDVFVMPPFKSRRDLGKAFLIVFIVFFQPSSAFSHNLSASSKTQQPRTLPPRVLRCSSLVNDVYVSLARLTAFVAADSTLLIPDSVTLESALRKEELDLEQK